MYSTFEDFLNKNYNRDTIYLDKNVGYAKFKFVHIKNRCSSTCVRTNFGVRCNGTAIRKVYTDESIATGDICSFPNDINEHINTFIKIESPNKRW